MILNGLEEVSQQTFGIKELHKILKIYSTHWIVVFYSFSLGGVVMALKSILMLLKFNEKKTIFQYFPVICGQRCC